jgi:hypothetical protein
MARGMARAALLVLAWSSIALAAHPQASRRVLQFVRAVQ